MSLLGLIVILAMAGALAGWSVSLLRGQNRPATNRGTAEYVDEVRRALFIRAKVFGSLPLADSDGDGQPNAAVYAGELPFVGLGVNPRDQWGRPVRYQVNLPGLTSTDPVLAVRKKQACTTLQALAVSQVAVRLGSDGADAADSADDLVKTIPSGSKVDQDNAKLIPPVYDTTNLFGWLLKNDTTYQWKSCP
jgi:hypothetical protein